MEQALQWSIKLSPRAVRQVHKLASKNRSMRAASIALEVAEEEGRSACQCSDHTPYTATSRFAWQSSRPRRKFWNDYSFL